MQLYLIVVNYIKIAKNFLFWNLNRKHGSNEFIEELSPKLRKHMMASTRYRCKGRWGLHAMVPPHPSKTSSSPSSPSFTAPNRGFFSDWESVISLPWNQWCENVLLSRGHCRVFLCVRLFKVLVIINHHTLWSRDLSK